MHDDDTHTLDRRELLCQAAATTCAFALLGCEVAEVKGGSVGGGVEFDLSTEALAPLVDIGGKAALADAGPNGVALFRVADDTIVAFDRPCPHQACPLDTAANYEAASDEIVCLCHQARFRSTGELTQVANTPPEHGGLVRYAVTFDPATGLGNINLDEIL